MADNIHAGESSTAARGRWALVWLGVAAIALAIRAVHLWQIRNAPVFDLLIGDARNFDRWAREIAAGDWIGSGVFYQAPLYAYFMGVIYAAGGHLVAVRVVQILLGTVACVLLGIAGSRFFCRRIGLLAALLLAVWPSAVFADGLIQKSALDGFLFCALLALLSAPAAGIRRWIAVGVTLAALVLTRENAVACVPILLLAIALRLPQPGAARGRIVTALAFLFGVGLVLLPVAARNRAVGGEWHLTSASFGHVFYIGNHSGAIGLYMPLRYGHGDIRYEQSDAVEMAEQALGRTLAPREVSAYWTGQATEFIVQHPAEWIALLGRKALLLVNRVEIGDAEDQYTYAEWSTPLAALSPWLHFGVLVPMAAAGIVLSWPRRRAVAVPLVLLGFYAFSVVLTFVMARYRHPLLPLLLLFAAAAVVDGLRQARARRWPLLGLALLVAAMVAVPANQTTIVSQASVHAQTLYNIGTALEERGAPLDTVIDSYRRALEVDPAYAPAYSNLGAALQRGGQPEQALPYLQRAVALQPDFGTYHYNLGIVLAALGDAAGAESAYRRAVACDPPNAEAYNNLGGIAFARGDLDDAARQFAAAVQADPHNARAMGNLGAVYIRQGQVDRAIDTLRAAIALDPGSPQPRQNLARLLTAAGRSEEAAAEYEALRRMSAGREQ
jgi:Flp pilus assembly protein TadD/4-amino-4-deoxy-L-arabinose transferase-like glycosyltransferase